MKTIAAVLELIVVLAIETVLWFLGVKPSDIELEEEWP